MTYEIPDCASSASREFGPEGAILVRPDRCIAFRAMGAADDPVGALRAALTQVLARAQ